MKQHNTKIEELLNEYILNPESDEINFSLAFEYDKIGQTATSVSYYLRSAERSENPLLQYECLIRASMCFNKQGTRNFTVKGLLQNAVSICPKRPEAYYLLSRFYEHEDKEGNWKDSFLIASIGENVCDFNSPSLRTEVDYPGKYGLLYQKALASWWCGLCDESRDIFKDLSQNYDLDENHKNNVMIHLQKFGETCKNLHSVYDRKKEKKDTFDWGIFQKDQMLYDCFKRDILDNSSYEKFFEVEEGDVVLDVGASVGPFTYSILNKNPKLVICLEPHSELFKTLRNNLSKFSNVVCLQKGISQNDGEVIFETLYDENSDYTSWEKREEGYGITLSSLVKEYNLEEINFLKIDCEGGEYDFFTEENFDWITKNVKKISGEWHFYRDHTRERFHLFRDKYFKYFKDYKIFFIDNDSNFYDITDEVWNDDFCQKYGWVNIYIDNRTYFDSSKLEGFPAVYCTSLEECEDRRKHIEKEFGKYNIKVEPYVFSRFENYNHKILGYKVENLDQRTLGPITSHIKMLHDWYYNSDDRYAVFCEDDISLETVQYWNFTWKEFFEKLPENWECVQMCLISEGDCQVQFKDRQIHDWGCQAYMVKKEFVKRILDSHYQYEDYENDTFDFTISNKSFLTPVIEHVLFDGKGKVYNCPLFVEDIYKFNSTYLEEEKRVNSFRSYHNILNWWKEHGPETPLNKIMEKQVKIIDFCSFYGPYGSEMLLLRYHILKDYVDEFVVSESSYSHTGIPVKYQCKNKIREWGLPEEKFKVIELETPPDEELVIEYIDELNCIDAISGNQQENMKSKWARVRDRLSKDALLKVLDDYDENTVFIHGDIDEIINPSYLADLVNICKNQDNALIYIPLIYLEGRADLRVYNKHWNTPQPWDWAMFMCKKTVLEKATPVQIRSNKLISGEIYRVNLLNNWNNEPVVDVGWHFSWMGGKESRLIKKQSWEHRYDSFDWLVTKKYDESDEFLSIDYKEGDTPPCGHVDLVLKSYPKENLPKEIFELPIVEKFLFPDYSIKAYPFNKVVDFFPYFDPCGRELLELRIKMLNDYVDEFVICESNKTQSGIPIEYTLDKVIQELNLPKSKIKIIQLEIPDDEELEILDIDMVNAFSYGTNNTHNINSLRSRVRERLQKDSLLKVLDNYDDNTLFIVGDSDEIINPQIMSWIPSVIKSGERTHIVKIPLAHLEGRADMRVCDKNNDPVQWNSLFLCTKYQLKIINPHQIRSNYNVPFEVTVPYQDGFPMKDLGWHFTWMGGSQKRIEKSKSFAHYDDSYSDQNEKLWDINNLPENLISDENIKDGDPSFSDRENLIFKSYPIENLPQEIFEIPHIKNFLLPEIKP